EAVHAEPLDVACLRQRAIADQPRAKERRCGYRVVFGRDRETEVLVRDRVLGVAAGKLVAGEARLGAQVFRSCTTVPAMPARSPEPRNADSIADPVTRRTGTNRFDAADDLVAGNERQHRIGQLAIDD